MFLACQQQYSMSNCMNWRIRDQTGDATTLGWDQTISTFYDERISKMKEYLSMTQWVSSDVAWNPKRSMHWPNMLAWPANCWIIQKHSRELVCKSDQTLVHLCRSWLSYLIRSFIIFENKYTKHQYLHPPLGWTPESSLLLDGLFGFSRGSAGPHSLGSAGSAWAVASS